MKVIIKKVSALFLVLCLTVGLMPTQAEAAEPNGFLSNEMGMITGYQGPGGDVVLPAKNQYGGDLVEFEDTLSFNRQTGAISAYALAQGNEWFQVKDGVLFNYGGDELISYPKASNRTEYTIPEGVIWVRDGAFIGANNLKSVNFPSGEWCGAGDYAFAECANLTAVKFHPECSFNSGDYVFQNCKALASLALPGGTEIVGEGMIDGCSALVMLGLPGTVDVPTGWKPANPALTVYALPGGRVETWCKYADVPFQPVEDYNAFAAGVYAGVTGTNTAMRGGEPSAWALKEVTGARAAGLVPLALDGDYTRNISRAEFAALACAWLDKLEVSKTGGTVTFPDTTDPTVLRAAGLGVITGYADGTYGPAKSIRRDEAAAMLTRCAKLLGDTSNAPGRVFSDGAAIGGWAKAGVDFITGCVVAKTGVAVMNGTSATEFSPAGNYTREQAISTFYRLYRYVTEERALLVDASETRILFKNSTVAVLDGVMTFTGIAPGEYGVWFYDADGGNPQRVSMVVDADGGGNTSLAGLANGRFVVSVVPTVHLATAAQLPSRADGIWSSAPPGHSFDPGTINKQGGMICWIAPPDYERNLQLQAEQNRKHRPEEYLDSKRDWAIQSGDSEIEALCAEITVGLTDDYQKALAIHDWVCANISYDMDVYFSRWTGVNRNQDAVSVLHNRLGVCEGFTNLTAALLRAAGVPARTVSGYTGQPEQYEYWPPVEQRQAGHAWNEAWVGGRWITIDATWDCANYAGHPLPEQYRDSPDYVDIDPAAMSGEVSWTYFDPDPMAFAASHRTVYYGIFEGSEE